MQKEAVWELLLSEEKQKFLRPKNCPKPPVLGSFMVTETRKSWC